MIEKITALFNSFIGVLDSIRFFFEGSKTYVVAGVMVGLGLYQKDQQMVLEGLALMTLRAGVSKMK